LKNPRILFLATHPKEVASTRYRVLAYQSALEKAGCETRFHPFFSSEALPKIYAANEWPEKAAWLARGLRQRLRILRETACDLVFIHRELFPLGMPAGMFLLDRELKRMGKPLLYDFDDAVFLPHRQGRGLAGRLENPRSVRNLIARSQRVIAGNAFLADYASRINPRVDCIPTPVDTTRYFPSDGKKNGSKLVIGWIGSPSTAKYLLSLIPVFEKLARSHPFQLKIIGAGERIQIPGVDVDCRTWDLATEAEEFRTCDIGLYPLWDDQWSRGKCGYKALQFMACGVPVVASEIGMSTEIIHHRTNGMLVRSEEEWVQSLRELLESPELRSRLGEAGRQSVTEHYSLTHLAPRFLQLLEESSSLHKERSVISQTAGPQRGPAAVDTFQDVLCLSSIDWDFVWQGHQEIMTTLARQGHRVLFVENTGVRGPRLRDLSRIQHRLGRWRTSVQGFWQVEPNLYVFSPLILPFPYAGWARLINRWLVLSVLRHWMQVMDFYQPICWAFLPTPLTLEVIRKVPLKLLVYYCIDNFAASTPSAKRIAASEKSLLQKADVVFVTSQQLSDHASRWNPRVHLFPFGVNLSAFERARDEEVETPAELRQLQGAIVGYVGGIHQWIDQELVAEVARRNPSRWFVLVGPVQTRVDRLKQEPNILLLGQKPHEEIPGYIKRFDAGIIPYRIAEYTNHVYPTKMNEYLAMGKPVVSTALPEVQAFNQRHGPVVEIAEGSEEFSRALERMLRNSDPSDKQLRLRVAGENAWGARIHSMQGILREAILRKEKKQMGSWSVSSSESTRSSYRIAQWGIALALLWAAVFHTPMVWLAAQPLQLPPQIGPADVIVVFAGGAGESGRADESYQERAKRAVELYQLGLAPRILFISGFTRTFQEADLMVAVAKNLGVPATALSKEIHVTNTYDYVLRIRKIAQQEGWHRLLLVTSPYHTRRAGLTFRHNAPELTVLQAPVSESNYYERNNTVTLRQIWGILRELAGLLFYWIRGWI